MNCFYNARVSNAIYRNKRELTTMANLRMSESANSLPHPIVTNCQNHIYITKNKASKPILNAENLFQNTPIDLTVRELRSLTSEPTHDLEFFKDRFNTKKKCRTNMAMLTALLICNILEYLG
jgi:hypothetical protein